MPISLAGVSHNTAPLAVRERAAVPAAALPALAGRFAAQWGGAAVVLATCARTEVYAAHPDPGAATAFFRAVFPDVPPAALYRARNEVAAAHLYTVVAGLDAPVPGEREIAHQVRRAYAAARAAATLPAALCRLFERALGAGRRIRARCERGRHAPSLLREAVARAAAGGGMPPAVIIGTGRAAQGLLTALARRGADTIVVSRRHRERAQALAAPHGMRSAPYDELAALLAGAGAAFTATDSPHAVLTAAHIVPRRGRLLTVIDLSFPRGAAPEIGTLPDVRLLTLDDLRVPDAFPGQAALRTELRARAVRAWAGGTA